MNQHDYRRSHAGKGSFSEGYDEKLFAEGNFDEIVWQRESRILDDIIDSHVAGDARLLDFATGTGRIVSHLESKFREAIGIDVSEDMLAVARTKVSRAQLIRGDLTRDEKLVNGCFDCITSFRFFLNAQPTLRAEAIQSLSRLMGKDSVLIFNIHGMKYSTRWPMLVINKLFGQKLYQMTQREVDDLVREAGLQIVKAVNVVWIDKSLYNYMPKILWRWMDKTMQRIGFLRQAAVYKIFVCKKI